MRENHQKHRRRLRRRPNGAAAFGGRRIGSVFVIYSLYIPYIFPSYVKYVFPCVFLNLWSQKKTSPYRKTTEILFFRDFTPFMFLLAIS